MFLRNTAGFEVTEKVILTLIVLVVLIGPFTLLSRAFANRMNAISNTLNTP